MSKRINNPTILEANFFYLIMALLLLVIGSIAQQWDLFKGLLITEYLIILLPTVLFIVIRNLIFGGSSLKRVLRLNPISFKQAIMIPIITLLSYPIGVFLNYIGIMIISIFGEIKPSPLPVPQTSSELLVSLFVVAVSAGICEEVMFRGLMLRAYERVGTKNAIIITAILFGAFHFNPQNLLGPTFLGILFGVLLIKTNSIFSSILAHGTNNAIAILLSIGLSKMQIFNEEQSLDALEQLNNMPIYTKLLSYAMALVFWGSIAVGCGFAVYFLIKALPKAVVNEEIEASVEEAEGETLSQIQDTSLALKVISIIPLIIASVLYVWLGYLTITL